MSRSTRLGLLVLTTAAIVAVLVWSWRDPDLTVEPEVPGTGESATVEQGDTSNSKDPDPQRELAAEVEPESGDDATPGKGPMLRVRLRGLVPTASWTAPLEIDLKGKDEARETWERHEADVGVAEDGTAGFRLPKWTTFATRQSGRLEATDANYRPLLQRFSGPLDTSRELVLDVQVIAVLEGRVVDVRGEPVSAARVTAFAIENGQPVEPQVGTTTTSIEGTYHVEVAPGVPLLLIATPMQPALISGHRLTGQHGAIADLGIPRADLLPAAREVHGVIGARTTIPDIVVPDAARITGVVQWPDGKPVPKVKIVTRRTSRDQAHSRPWRDLQVSASTGVRKNADGSVALGVSTWTDENGEFELPARPNQRVHLAVAEVPDVLFFADIRMTTDPAPIRALIRLPAPIRVRVTKAGQPVPGAIVEKNAATWRTGDDGCLDVVLQGGAERIKLRGRHGRFRSPIVRLVPTQAGTTVNLPLTDALTEVAIEFEGDFRVRNASFHWRDTSGSQSSARRQRSDGSGPFRLHLPPDQYELRVGPAPGERNGNYLLPVERTIDVGTADMKLTLPARYGGKLTIHATDSSGRYVGGSCRIRDRDGVVLRGAFAVENMDRSQTLHLGGNLAPGGPNTWNTVLAPGDYELELGFEHLGAERRIVTIRPREVTDVRVRLP